MRASVFVGVGAVMTAVACGSAPGRRVAPGEASPSCEEVAERVKKARALERGGRLDRGLAALGELTPRCAMQREVLAARLALLLALDDVAAAQEVAGHLLAAPHDDDAARLAREAMARQPPRDTAEAMQSLAREGSEALRRGDAVAGSRLLDRALHALERIAGERAVLDGFFPRWRGDWRAGIGYQPATSIRTGEMHTLLLRYHAASDGVALPWFAFSGGGAYGAGFARARERVVVAADDALLLYQGVNAPAQRIAGSWARFTRDGAQLVVLADGAVRVVDAASAETVSQMPVVHRIAGLTTRSAWLDEHRLYVAGDCAKDVETIMGATCVLVVDIASARVVVDRAATEAVLSPTRRFVALMEIVSSGKPFPNGVLTVWDQETSRWSPRVDVGSLFPAPKGIQFGPEERKVILFEPGLGALNTYTARKLVGAVHIATGQRSAPPALSEVVPYDDSERWAVLSPELRGLAQAPRALVPTERGPGRSHGFAETRDGRTIAVLEGVVARAGFAGTTTRAPHLLIVDGPTKKLQRRIVLPVEPDRTFLTALVYALPDDRTFRVCLVDGDEQSLLIDAQISKVAAIAGIGCYGPVVSEDGTALVDERTVVDVATWTTHTLPFVNDVSLLHTAGEPKAQRRLVELPPEQVVCRAGGFLAPRDVCRDQRL